MRKLLGDPFVWTLTNLDSCERLLLNFAGRTDIEDALKQLNYGDSDAFVYHQSQ